MVAVAASFAADLPASTLSAVASSRLEQRTGSAMGSRLHEDYCAKTRAEDDATYGSTPPGYASNKAAMSSVLPFARMAEGFDEVVDHIDGLAALSALVCPGLVIHAFHTAAPALNIGNKELEGTDHDARALGHKPNADRNPGSLSTSQRVSRSGVLRSIVTSALSLQCCSH